MSDILQVLETRVRKVVEELHALRRENDRLKSECEALKAQIALSTTESRKVQKTMAEYEQMKRSREVVVTRVERALHKLNNLRVLQ